jgi:hypothetical protein
MVQTTKLSSSAPPTPSDPSNSLLSRATSQCVSCLPKSQSKSTQRLEPLSFSRRSFSDPLRSNASRRCSNNPHESSETATGVTGKQEGRSQHSVMSATSGGEEGERCPIAKRHSHPNHNNIYTECGRHGDDWLFGGFSVTGAVKQMFEKRSR